MNPIARRPSLARLAVATLCSTALAAGASTDIDIFTAGAGTTTRPNILIILDNSSNWNATLGPNPCNAGDTKFDAEICALDTVAGQLKASPFPVRLGLMMFAETGENGGYMRYAIRDIDNTSATNVANGTALQNLVRNFVRLGSGTDNSGSNQPYGKVMFEAFKYFGGYTDPANALTDTPGGPTVGRTGFGSTAFAGWTSDSGGDIGAKRRDYKGNVPPPPVVAANRSATFYGADNAATAFPDKSTQEYTSPISLDLACGKNFIVFISNGNPSVGGDAGGTASATQLLTNVKGVTTQITVGGVPIHDSTMDEWARYLKATDVSPHPGQQKVTTYTVAVYQPQSVVAGVETISNTDQQMIKLMKSAASAGGGKYFKATNATQLLQAILQILNEVQAVNSVFVSASLPVSVNTQGTFLNQVYMGMFRPDATGNPRWLGNLKQYKFTFDVDTGELFLSDALGVRAVNPSTGFVSPAAKSYWTADSGFWLNSPSGTPSSKSDLPDGEVVEKGGAAQKLRAALDLTHKTRNILTCPPGGCPAGAAVDTPFDSGTISGVTYEAAFGAASAAELEAIVNWVRGEDNVNGTPCDPLVAPCLWGSAESGPGWTTVVRPSVHGDVLHSRPVVLNYDPALSGGASGPYIFYGANDGVLHAVKGGQDPTSDGVELWSFVAPEFYSGIVALGGYNKYTRLRGGIPALKLPSTPPGILPAPQEKDYFFDGPIGSYQKDGTAWIFVTARRGGRIIYALDVSNPEKPILLWKKTSADLPGLAQTWSEPKAILPEGMSKPVILFGGGYHPAEDLVPPGPTTAGNRIFVLDAETGADLSAGGFAVGSKSIPSDIATVDLDFNGTSDRGYVGDLGGDIWRIDMKGASPSTWQIGKLASLGVTRKFFFQPDLVLGKDFLTVVIGSGDREKPLDPTSLDRFYGIRDTFADIASIVTINEGSLVASGTPVGTAKGWYIDMLRGEKVVNSPLTIAGVTYFSTNQPSPPPAPGVCTANLGFARAYGVDFTEGTAGLDRNGDGLKNSSDLFTPLTGGGLPPSPVGGVVELDDGRKVGFIIGSGTGGSAIEGGRVRISVPMVRTKIYWNTKTDKATQ